MSEFLNGPLKPDQKAFIADNILFLQNWRRTGADDLPWLIFNGDNTLWDVEALYDEARDVFSRFLALKFIDPHNPKLAALQAAIDADPVAVDFTTLSSGVADLGAAIKTTGDESYRRYVRTANIIDLKQRETDVSLRAMFGYDPERFPTSFVRTVESLVDGDIPAAKQNDPDYQDTVALAKTAAAERNRIAEESYAIARTVFNRAAKVYDRTLPVLEAAGHEYRLMMLTAGEVLVQMKRLKDLGCAHLFECVAITEKKTASTFSTVCNHLSAKPENVTMVGDSLSSDIETANALGLKTVWVMHHNWEAENRGRVVPDATLRIKEIENLPAALQLKNALKTGLKADEVSWYRPRTGFGPPQVGP